jgi:hypothetical protein
MLLNHLVAAVMPTVVGRFDTAGGTENRYEYEFRRLLARASIVARCIGAPTVPTRAEMRSLCQISGSHPS